MWGLLADAYSKGLQLKPKCPLTALVMTLGLSKDPPLIISMGMLMIFPSLVKFVTRSPVWARLELTVVTLGQAGERLTAMTENFVKTLIEARKHAVNGVPVLPPVSPYRSV